MTITQVYAMDIARRRRAGARASIRLRRCPVYVWASPTLLARCRRRAGHRGGHTRTRRR